jgi:transposase
MVLGVGIDWAEAFHLVALGHPEEGVIQIRRVEHTPAAVDQLIAQIAALEPDPAEVRVVIETRHGLLVERLLDAGYVVLPVNPDLVARRRGPARKKDDAEDARIACLLALDRHTGLRPLVPHGEVATELRAIARDDERAARDQRRLLNRLRHDLLSTYPAALAIAGDDLGAPTVLKLLQRWPTRDLLAAVSRQELVAFARANRHGWPERLADKIIAALTADQFTPRDYLVRAKADTIRLAATQLLAIATQRRTWERRMGELLVGTPRAGRAGCWHRHDQDDARLGEPLCPSCYDAQAQVLWNALAPELWRRTTIAIHRALGRLVGLQEGELRRLVRISYAKVAEFQRRGRSTSTPSSA